MPEDFDKAFEEAARNIDFTPDFEASWQRVEKKLKRRRRRPWNRLRMLPYIALSFVLGALLFGTPTFSRAFAPFFESLQNVQDGLVHVVIGSQTVVTTKPKTAPPPGYQPPSREEHEAGETIGVSTEVNYDSWEEAKKNLSFKPPAIGYVPPGYTLDHVMVSIPFQKDKANLAGLIYSHLEDKVNGGYSILIKQIATGEKISSDYDENAGKLEILDIDGKQGYLFLTNDGYSGLDFRYGQLYVSIAGDLDREQILQVGKQIQLP
ncbi:DUF4367 domain-containing protein [Cohnella zeiphila]|uniref:DUF4367 domain-containing protein n=1 Tax=Cohnella zeiphila TaxID=2761120 RepID=A0A7X0SKY0_9BACL|nr:DUF4367 domain-containing protein [Cohnella zeiphila]MBB6731836.1 DUF4367 domain-containing protein [Cohnella zeiphila]